MLRCSTRVLARQHEILSLNRSLITYERPPPALQPSPCPHLSREPPCDFARKRCSRKQTRAAESSQVQAVSPLHSSTSKLIRLIEVAMCTDQIRREGVAFAVGDHPIQTARDFSHCLADR
uniref:Uncharacterized protein n=1 Tax=Haptolina ericina TaxID=156174 RepID=A0A7S3FAV9_9EUKA